MQRGRIDCWILELESCFPGSLKNKQQQEQTPLPQDDKKLEGVLILQNSFLKLKTVVDNAILRNYAVSSENISELIKIQTENGFHLKRNVCKFR